MRFSTYGFALLSKVDEMATVNHGGIEATISSEAMQLLDCCDDRFGEVILSLAENSAKARARVENAVEISGDDIKQAAELLASIIRASDKIPADIIPVIDEMCNCVNNSSNFVQ